MYKRRNHVLMAAIGAALSGGASAIAAAYPDDKLRARHVDTEQECAFDDRAQLASFMNGVADPDKWTVYGVDLAAPGADHAATFDTTGATELATAIAQADAQAEQIATTGGKHIDIDLEQLRTDVAANREEDTASSTDQAAPAATTADTPAAE